MVREGFARSTLAFVLPDGVGKLMLANVSGPTLNKPTACSDSQQLPRSPDKQQGGSFPVWCHAPEQISDTRLSRQDGTVAPEVLFKVVSVEGELGLLRVAVELCGRQRTAESKLKRSEMVKTG